MGIVADQQQRSAAAGQTHCQPVEAVQNGAGCLLSSSAVSTPQHQASGRRRTGEQLAALTGLIRLGEQRLEQLTDHPVGEVGLQRGADGPTDPKSARPGRCPRSQHQLRLADTRRTLERFDPPFPRCNLVEEILEQCAFLASLHQPAILLGVLGGHLYKSVPGSGTTLDPLSYGMPQSDAVNGGPGTDTGYVNPTDHLAGVEIFK